MFRASTTLSNARLERELTFDEISKKIKVPAKYLEALETENTKNFPSEPYCSLIVKDYADFLGLNGKEILAFFRRDFEQKLKTTHGFKRSFGFTPHFTFSLAIVVLVIIFSVYLVGEYLKFNSPPKLKINWPAQLAQIGESTDITGVTDPEATVRVNGDLIITDNNGKFRKKISIATSEAKIRVESKSPSGKITVEEKTLKQ